MQTETYAAASDALSFKQWRKFDFANGYQVINDVIFANLIAASRAGDDRIALVAFLEVKDGIKTC